MCRMGFRHLNLSNNPIGDEGVLELCFAVERSNTLRQLLLHGCQITDKGAGALRKSMADNPTIVVLDVTDNWMSSDLESLTRVSTLANYLYSLYTVVLLKLCMWIASCYPFLMLYALS